MQYKTLLKSIIHSFVLSFVFFVLFTAQVNAQWQQVSGLYGEPVYSLRSTPNKLFALTLAGVLRSDNNGSSWTVVPELYLTNVIERISASGTTIVCYAFPENYISTDDGITWNELNPPSGSVFSSDLIVEGNTIYMSTYGDYIYKSINGGVSWTQSITGLTTSEINCLWAEGNNVYAGTDDGVFKSSDGGDTFTLSGLGGEYVTRVYTKSPYVFSFCTSGVFRSGDDGATWIPFEPAIPYADITDFLVDNNKVYAATNGDLITSNVTLPNWLPVNFTQNISFNNSLCMQGSSIFVGNNRGVFESSNSGVTWSDKNTGIIPVNTVSITVLNNDTLFAGSSIYGVSSYQNSAWTFSGIPYLNANDLVTNGNDVFSASEFGIHKSSDGGASWELINNVLGNPIVAYCADIAVADTMIIGAALQAGILRTGDYGLSWTTQNTGIAPSLVSSVAIIGSNLIAGTYDNGLFTSTDGGFNWTPTGATGELINDLTVIGNNVIAASSGPDGNYISTDQGLTWNPVFSDYFDNLSTSGSYVIASSPGYIQLSMDSGFTYVNFTPPPSGTTIASSVASATDVYIGTYYDGVWKISISEINSLTQVEDNSVAAKIHPNIFSSEAWLHIDEKLAQSNPELQITDVNGKLVYSLRIQDTTTRITSGSLSDGIYFYRVVSDKYKTKAGKLVIH